VLHRLTELDAQLREAIANNAFTGFYTALHNFCATDLSAFYFDIRKDALYCDASDAPRRRACRTVLAHLFECLTSWLAPVLCFTAEEAFLARLTDQGVAHGAHSVHLRQFATIPAAWRDAALGARWTAIRAARSVVTGALELARAAKKIGASLQAAPVVHVDATHAQALRGIDVDELFITSGARIEPLGQDTGHVETFALPDVPGVAVAFATAEGAKCERCWRVLREVGAHKAHPKLCLRCADAVGDRVQPVAAQ
jgi:isoleucyl-tRNA synthetase